MIVRVMMLILQFVLTLVMLRMASRSVKRKEDRTVVAVMGGFTGVILTLLIISIYNF